MTELYEMRQALGQGVDANVHVHDGQSHGDHAAVPNAPESHEHCAELNAFLLNHLQ